MCNICAVAALRALRKARLVVGLLVTASYPAGCLSRLPFDLISKVCSPSRYATSGIAVGVINLPELPHHDKAETTTRRYIHNFCYCCS